MWTNRESPAATPRYRVLFTPHNGGRAMPPGEVVGTDALLVFFLKLQSPELPVQFRNGNAKAWAAAVHATGSHEVLYDFNKNDYEKWLGEEICECGHGKSAHAESSDMRVDEALISREPALGNIETDEPRGKTRCHECRCLTWRPAQTRAKAAEQR